MEQVGEGLKMQNRLMGTDQPEVPRGNGKLEQLPASQTLQKDRGRSEALNSPEKGFSEFNLNPPPDNKPSRKTRGPRAPVKGPSPRRVAISAREVDAIFQKVEKIHHDAEIRARVDQLERQTRTITLFGSMSMTLTVLMLGLFAYFMVPATLLNKGGGWPAAQGVAASQPPVTKTSATSPEPQVPGPGAQGNEPKVVEPRAKGADPAAGLAPAPKPDPRPAAGPAPVKYVAFLNSHKYHLPGCKWAAGINNYRHRTFSSAQEARAQGYIPCPTCMPAHAD